MDKCTKSDKLLEWSFWSNW